MATWSVLTAGIEHCAQGRWSLPASAWKIKWTAKAAQRTYLLVADTVRFGIALVSSPTHAKHIPVPKAQAQGRRLYVRAAACDAPVSTQHRPCTWTPCTSSVNCSTCIRDDSCWSSPAGSISPAPPYSAFAVAQRVGMAPRCILPSS